MKSLWLVLGLCLLAGCDRWQDEYYHFACYRYEQLGPSSLIRTKIEYPCKVTRQKKVNDVEWQDEPQPTTHQEGSK